MIIYKFEQYINESYLKSGRQPLYHYINAYSFDKILESDIFKKSQPAFGDECICFTRSLYFEEHASSIRFVFNAELLRQDGYKITPVDEVGLSNFSNGVNKHNRLKGYSKSNPYFSGRKTIHKLDLKQDLESNYGGLEWEYEERIHSDIKNLGKYLIAIDLEERVIVSDRDILKNYLDKYPHIEITIMNPNKRFDRRNIIDFNKYYDEHKTNVMVNPSEYVNTK